MFISYPRSTVSGGNGEPVHKVQDETVLSHLKLNAIGRRKEKFYKEVSFPNLFYDSENDESTSATPLNEATISRPRSQCEVCVCLYLRHRIGTVLENVIRLTINTGKDLVMIVLSLLRIKDLSYENILQR